MKPEFSGGINIAIKVPKNKYKATVAFYRDVLGLQTIEQPITNPTVSRTHKVTFGLNTVWLDCVDNYTHSEVWLEVNTPDPDAAADYLATKNIPTTNEFEHLPDGMHWISDPAGTVMIIKPKGL